MNREIKFRAIMSGTDRWIIGLPHSVYSDNEIDSIQCIDGKKIEYIRTDTLGQYTGLKDKNGIEIYDGDIIVGNPDCDIIKERKFTVCWENAGWALRELKYLICFITDYEILQPEEWAEVIGNIYENPELLNK
jgi:hypothetical protein